MPKLKIENQDEEAKEPVDTTGIGSVDEERSVEDDQAAVIAARERQIAFMKEEMTRMSAIVNQLAKKQSIPTGEAEKEFLDAESNIPHFDGKRFVDMKRVGSYEVPKGEAVETHYTYDITLERPDGTLEVEENVPYQTFANRLKTATRVPVAMPNYLRRVQEGDHYVNRSDRTLQRRPYKQDDDIEVVFGRFLPDGKTIVYDGVKKTVKFHTLKAN